MIVWKCSMCGLLPPCLCVRPVPQPKTALLTKMLSIRAKARFPNADRVKLLEECIDSIIDYLKDNPT